ncbi:hypothetical protein KGM48_01720 [Patescibacteria group bacterium]|nr:hypothetical protein [Patescibacteria group bacterium]
MNKKNSILVAIALVVGFGAGYALHTVPVAPTEPTATRMGGGTYNGMRGGMNGGGFLSGTVAAKDSGSITLDTRDGSSHIIILTPATVVSKSVSGALTDVTVGSTAMVSGTTNSDGSVSANIIQLRPTFQPSTAP